MKKDMPVPDEIPSHIIDAVANLKTVEQIHDVLNQARDIMRRVFSLGIRSQRTVSALLATLCVKSPVRARAFAEGLMEGEVEALERDDVASLYFVLFLTAFIDGLLSGKGLTVAAMGASPENVKVGELLRFRTIWSRTILEAIQSLCVKKEMPLILRHTPSSLRSFGRASQHYYLARHDPRASSGFLSAISPAFREHIALSLSQQERFEFEEMASVQTGAHDNTDQHAMLIVEPSVDYATLDVLTEDDVAMFERYAPKWGFTLSMLFKGKTTAAVSSDVPVGGSDLWHLFRVGTVERAIRAERLQSWQLLRLILSGTAGQIMTLEQAMGLDMAPPLRPRIQDVVDQFSEFLFSSNEVQVPDERVHIVNKIVGFSTKKFSQDIFIDTDHPVIRAILDHKPMNAVVETWVGNANLETIVRGKERALLDALENIFP